MAKIACGYHNFVQYHEGPPCVRTKQKKIVLGPEPKDPVLDATLADRKDMLRQLEILFAPSLVVHIIPAAGEKTSFCNRTKGRATHDPVAATPLMRKQDRFCSLCWNRWAKREAA